jgi:hypothetical protein
MSKDILYTPDLSYKKDYYTDGVFKQQNENNELAINDRTLLTKISSINSLQQEVNNNLKLIPNQIKNTYLSPYVVLRKEIDNIIINYEPEENNNMIIDEVPSDFFSKDTDIYIDIKDPYAEKSNIIQEQYKIDFLDVYKDYLEKLNINVQNYIYSSLSAINISRTLSDLPDLNDYSTKALNNKDLYHLSDYLIKSNIRLEQMLRLHEKLFDIDSAILHVRGIKIAEKSIERYYNIERQKEDNELGMTSNILLEESKRIADKKYKENFLALYKYLNSSVILMNESLQTLLKENKSAMAINIYEVREKINDNNTTN